MYCIMHYCTIIPRDGWRWAARARYFRPYLYLII